MAASPLALAFLLLLQAPASPPAQSRDRPEQSRDRQGADIKAAWDQLLRDVIPQTSPDPVFQAPQAPVARGPAADFQNHFFLETRTEYIRQEISFTGLPTVTGVIDAPRGILFDPRGIPFHDAFQPNSDQIYSFWNWGTRGWLSDRVDTNFSFRYRQNLRHVPLGSPLQSVLNAFGADRRLELLAGTIEIKSLGSEGAWANSSLKLGRQHMYGAELAAFDGASFYLHQRRYALTLFGGRRFSYFTDPDQRAIGGGNLLVPLGSGASLEYQASFYIKGSHLVTFRKQFEPNWHFSTYFKAVGGSPVDYNAQVFYLPTNGKTPVRVSFFQKLSNKDFFYDATLNARDLDRFNRFTRLNLGPIPQYSQVVVDGRRELLPRLRVGGTIWIRRLNDQQNDQGLFAASFDDYRIHLQAYPVRHLEALVDLHQRNTDRSNPLGHVLFDDVSIAGETRMQEVSAQLRRAFLDGRVALGGGAFWRRFNFQDRFFFIPNAQIRGWLGNAHWRVDQHTRLFVDYALDNDFFLFRPQIRRAQVLRLGVNWKY